MPSFHVVGRASAALGFLPDQQLSLTVKQGSNGIVLAFQTEYLDEGVGSLVPRSLIARALGEWATIEEAIDAGVFVASELVPLLSLSANAPCESLVPFAAVQADEGVGERQFIQNVLDDPRGAPRPFRQLDVAVTKRLIERMDSCPEKDHVLRAAAHYGEALNHWSPGDELRCVEHLFQAAEVLSLAICDALCRERGVTKQDLENEFEVDKGSHLLAALRKTYVFGGDKSLAKEIRQVSDAYEHGYRSFDEIRVRARNARGQAAVAIRTSILRYAGMTGSGLERLVGEPFDAPKESRPFTKLLRGEVRGLKSLSHLGEYPRFVNESTIKSLQSNPDGTYQLEMNESFRPLKPDGVSITVSSLEVRGNP